ncbi:hypothetical protein [Chryseobacterium wanjuense]
MDFPIGTTKGIILPQVINNMTMTDVSAGTFVFDGVTAKTKFYNGILLGLKCQAKMDSLQP